MGAFGADVGQLRALGREFRRGADVLEGDVLASVSRSVGASGWRGPDADAFRGAWSGALSAQLRGVRDALRAAAGDVDRHAREQEQASQATGSANGSVTGGPGLSAGDSGQGVIVNDGYNYSPNKLDPRKDGIVREHVDMATLASDAYNLPGSKDAGQYLKNGWSRVSDTEIKALGIDPKRFVDDSTGFKSAFYKNTDGSYVIAFSGTDGPSAIDWVNNAAGATGVHVQDKQAVALSTYVVDQLEKRGIDPNRLSFTGHSLGGRLSDDAAVATGLNSTTFNPAGQSLLAYEHAKNTAFKRGISLSPEQDRNNSVAIVDEDDPVNALRALGAPDPLGEITYVDDAAGKGKGSWFWQKFDDHSIDTMQNTLNEEILGNS